MADKYLIPFGIDGTETFKTFEEIGKSSEKLGDKVDDTLKDMQKSMIDASDAGEKLNKTLQNDAKSLALLKDQARQAGEAIKNSISGKVVDGSLEQKVKALRDTLAQLQKNNAKLGINVDEASFNDFNKKLAAAGDDIKQLALVADFAKEKLANMAPDSAEFAGLSQQVAIAEGFIEGLGTTINDVVKVNKTLKSELRTTREEMARLELAGQGDSEAFKDMAVRAGELEDQIGDVSARVKVLASDTKYLDAGIQAIQGLAGGFAAAQGAAALFGDENEEAAKVIQKVTGAMAILQGVQEVANALNKDSALVVVVLNALRSKQVAVTAAETVAEVANTTATATNTAATVANTAAETANTVSEVVNTGATVAATAAVVAETTATAGATVATNAFTVALLANPIGLIVAAIAAAAAALYIFASASNEAEAATEALNEVLEFENRILDENLTAIERATQRRIALAKSQGKAESEITDITVSGLRQQVTERRTSEQELVKQETALRIRMEKGEGDAEKNAEALKAIEDQRRGNKKAALDAINQIEIEGLNQQTQRNKEAEDAAKKRAEAERKAAELRKKVADQILKFTKELQNAEVAQMEEGLAKQKEEINLRAKQQVDALNNEVALSKKAQEIRSKAIVEINKKRDADLIKADNDTAKKRIELQMEANSIGADLIREGIDKELESLKSGYEDKKAEIEEKFKDEETLRIKLLQALEKNYSFNEAKIRKEAAAKSLEVEEESAILSIELMTKYATESVKVEQFKQIEILKIKLEYANKRLSSLTDDGTAESQLAIKQAKKTVQDITKALDTAVKEQGEKGIDLFDIFGLGDLSDKDKEKIKDGLGKSFEAIGQITDFVVGQYQRQIDKKQELIDSYDKDISDLEDRLEEEKELQEAGFANNVGLLEAELAAKKAAQDEEIRQQEELQKKQQALQKAQLIADTALQASNLITASTSIFKSFATIPFGLGIPLAIATVGLMTGAFIASKIKAFQSVNDQKLGEGGEVDGPAHTQGGVKYRSIDGSGKVVELEGKEFVIRKSKAQDPLYRPMIEAINSGKTSHLTDEYLEAFLEGTGVARNRGEVANAVVHINENSEAKTLVVKQNSEELSDIKKNVAFMADKERKKVERWEDDLYYYELQYTTLTKKPKNKTD